MKFLEYILMSLRDLWRRKGRTILTALGITIGTLLIVTMVGLGSGVKQFMNDVVNDQDSARNISVQPYKYMTADEQDNADPATFEDEYYKPITDEFIQNVEKTNLTESVTAKLSDRCNYIKYNGKEYKAEIGFTAYNKTSNIFTNTKIEEVRNRKDDNSLEPIEKGEMISGASSEILIGQQILDKMDVSLDDAVGSEIELVVKSRQTGELKSKKFKIIGVTNENFDEGDKVIMPVNDASELLSFIYTEKDYFKAYGYDYATVITSTINDVEDVSDKIKDLDYMYSSSIDMAKEIDEKLGGINTAFAVLGVIVLVVSAIGIVNTMAMAVMERTKSIGVMKSVGANSGAIRTMFLVQSSLIGAIGGGFGILFGLGINALVQLVANAMLKAKEITSTITIGLPWYILVGIFAFSVLIALVSGIYPAIKASKLDPIEALRR